MAQAPGRGGQPGTEWGGGHRRAGQQTPRRPGQLAFGSRGERASPSDWHLLVALCVCVRASAREGDKRACEEKSAEEPTLPSPCPFYPAESDPGHGRARA